MKKLCTVNGSTSLVLFAITPLTSGTIHLLATLCLNILHPLSLKRFKKEFATRSDGEVDVL